MAWLALVRRGRSLMKATSSPSVSMGSAAGSFLDEDLAPQPLRLHFAAVEEQEEQERYRLQVRRACELELAAAIIHTVRVAVAVSGKLGWERPSRRMGVRLPGPSRGTSRCG